MKNPLEHLDHLLEHRVRLQIMAVLVAHDTYDFNSFKEILGVTDGNLATHLRALEKEKYITVTKTFLNRKPHTKYKATAKGRHALEKHLRAMEEFIKSQQ